MEKRGSHVGIVLSFVIFTTFITFLYVVTQPAIKLNDNQYLAEKVKANIIRWSSAELTIGSIIIDTPGTCAKLDNFFTTLEIEPTLLGKNQEGDNIALERSLGGEAHLRAFVNGNSLFRFYESSEFTEINSEGGEACTGESYNVGFVRSENIVFDNKIQSLNTEYETDYEGLKETLEIPPTNGFGFEFIYNNGTKITSEEKTVPRTNLYVQTFPLEYIKQSSASREIGNITIKVW